MTVEIHELTISKFRGIPYTREFQFDGENVVVTGPNGSGKSTVLQAIEFLFTGGISALKGTGTGRIYENQHIPNRQSDPAETYVQATLQVESGEQFTVRREFSNRNELTAEVRPPEFRDFLQAVKNGGLGLTRAELLELIIATPGTRKDQLQRLLNIEGVDERRRQLKNLDRKASTEAEKRDDRATQQLQTLADFADVSANNLDAGLDRILHAVNDHRAALGGDPIDSLGSNAGFRDGLQSPLEQLDSPLQRSDAKDAIESLQEWIDDDRPSVLELIDELQTTLEALRADNQALSELSELSLVRNGQRIVDSSSIRCPLCQATWDEGELKAQLEAREQRLSRIEDRTNKVDTAVQELTRELNRPLDTAEGLLGILEGSEEVPDLSPLQTFVSNLETTVTSLDRERRVIIEELDLKALRKLVEEGQLEALLNNLVTTAESLPGKSALQKHWDELGRAATAHQKYQLAVEERRKYERAKREFSKAHKEFLAARDDVLGTLYESISDRFHDLYAAVNPDEDEHDIQLNPTNTGVELSIDFFDGEESPPNALHSEGHQDTMGVCLFLALAEHMAEGQRVPVLLDDVVMSVDRTHRHRIANLFATELSDLQLILTTHDRDWAEELQSVGAIKSKNTIEFEGWNLHAGPKLS